MRARARPPSRAERKADGWPRWCHGRRQRRMTAQPSRGWAWAWRKEAWAQICARSSCRSDLWCRRNEAASVRVGDTAAGMRDCAYGETFEVQWVRAASTDLTVDGPTRDSRCGLASSSRIHCEPAINSRTATSPIAIGHLHPAPALRCDAEGCLSATH